MFRAQNAFITFNKNCHKYFAAFIRLYLLALLNKFQSTRISPGIYFLGLRPIRRFHSEVIHFKPLVTEISLLTLAISKHNYTRSNMRNVCNLRYLQMMTYAPALRFSVRPRNKLAGRLSKQNFPASIAIDINLNRRTKRVFPVNLK